MFISTSLKTTAQGQDSNPDPEPLQATSPEDQGAACPRFPGVESLQAEANNDCLKVEASQTKEIIAPNGGTIKVPNGGKKKFYHLLHGLEVCLGDQ
ncbi:hypothetical protein DSO57_1035787 [Entomophthora muscae]|uniref:Uncharacterized protein n=1 Tax=Entomophthora muscae TaxID=34485 RepID=A0ACC2RE37_9FUNG|nr:hypothetical protein DSO57_1035787 [Entomophthora muscae]